MKNKNPDPKLLRKIITDFAQQEYELCGKKFVINFDMLFSESVSEIFGISEADMQIDGLSDREVAIKALAIYSRLIKEKKLRKLLSFCLVEKGKLFNEKDRQDNEELFGALSRNEADLVFQQLFLLKYSKNFR